MAKQNDAFKARCRSMYRALVAVGLLLMNLPSYAADHSPWALVVHGGAMGQLTAEGQELRAQMARSLEAAVKAGAEDLAAGASSLDVVEKVVRLLEDDPLFNAGRGAVLNANGEHELDASIMDGRTLRCGAVAGVRTVQNPIMLARLVMEKTPHVLLIGAGAETFADEVNVPRKDADYFRTPERIREWERRQMQPSRKGALLTPSLDSHWGTVGCVALDRQGHLAAATSTGGIVGKKFGRVGDSPIIGAGTYADDTTCAVSCTGRGEEFIRRAVAHEVAAQMRWANRSLDEAARDVIENQLPKASGGLIAVDRSGRVVVRFNTPGMARAWSTSSGDIQVIVGP